MINISISILCVCIAAILNAYMDKWMMKYINCPQINFGWYSFDPLAKWHNRVWNSKRSNNILLEKLGIKTKFLTDNCNDGWHFYKSIMVCLICLAIVINIPYICYFKCLLFIILGCLWNIFFNKNLY